MKVIFISGPYRAKTERELVENIRHAENASIRLWRKGWAVFCPHLNTAHFGGTCEDKVWLDGDLEILSRCDAIYMLSTWLDSTGAKAEYRKAQDLNMEIFFEDDNGFGEYD